MGSTPKQTGRVKQKLKFFKKQKKLSEMTEAELDTDLKEQKAIGNLFIVIFFIFGVLTIIQYVTFRAFGWFNHIEPAANLALLACFVGVTALQYIVITQVKTEIRFRRLEKA